MAGALEDCWAIKKCGRENGRAKVGELGECVASTRRLGHSCWAIAGTLCGGAVQGTFAEKEGNCMACEVYKRYHRTIGTQGAAVLKPFQRSTPSTRSSWSTGSASSATRKRSPGLRRARGELRSGRTVRSTRAAPDPTRLA